MLGKYLGLLAVVAAASAQNISPACNTYLQQLDNDSTLSQCATPLLEATAHFNPVSASSDGNSSVQDTLAMICSSATQFCSNSLLQVTLNQFFASCSAEMGGTTAVPAVQSLYDSLYMLPAFKTAVCATDANTQQSCLMQMGTSSATVSEDQGSQSDAAAAMPVHEAAANATVNLAQEAAPSIVANATDSLGTANVTDMRVGVVALAMKSDAASFDISAVAGSVLNAPSLLYQAAAGIKQAARRRLVRRQEYTPEGTPIPSGAPSNNNTTDAATLIDSAIVPNTTTFTDSYLHFLFLNPDMTTDQLCTPCTQQILASYVSWEGMQPYPIGISNSGMLGVQIKLYRAVATRCGAGFAQHINVIAGQKTLQGSASTLKNSAWALAAGMLVYLVL